MKLESYHLALIAGILSGKDAYTSGHSARVAIISYHILSTLKNGDLNKIFKMSEIGGKKRINYKKDIAEISQTETEDYLITGALLHDIGKAAIPDYILNDNEGLSPEHLRTIRMHPEIGYKMLTNAIPHESINKYIVDIILNHQENFDGRGYPYGKSGTDIPLIARIVTAADIFDACTTNRTYQKKRTWLYIMETELTDRERVFGKQLDTVICSALIEWLNSYGISVKKINPSVADIEEIIKYKALEKYNFKKEYFPSYE